MILQPYDINEQSLRNTIAANDPELDLNEISDYFNFDRKAIYRPHLSAGLGLKIAMNDNFVLSVDWAVPFNKQDNASMANLYVKMGYMF